MIYLWAKQHSSWVLYWWNLIEPLDVCWWHLRVLSKCMWVAKYTRCVSGLCRIAWMQHNCLRDVWDQESKKHGHPVAETGGQSVKSVTHYKYLGIVLDTELSDDRHSETTGASGLYRLQEVSREFLFPMFERSEKCIFSFCSFCTFMYASQLWCNFRKADT